MRRTTRSVSPRLLALAILAVCLHALMPLLMAWPAPGGVMMSLCSPQGSRNVFVQLDNSAPDSRPDNPFKDLSARCPLCLAGAHLALNSPLRLALPLLTGLHHEMPQRPAESSPVRRESHAWQSRAPPALSV
jgi:hypothetical protein